MKTFNTFISLLASISCFASVSLQADDKRRHMIDVKTQAYVKYGAVAAVPVVITGYALNRIRKSGKPESNTDIQVNHDPVNEASSTPESQDNASPSITADVPMGPLPEKSTSTDQAAASDTEEEIDCGTGIVNSGLQELPARVLNAHHVFGQRRSPRDPNEEPNTPAMVQSVSMVRPGPGHWETLKQLWYNATQKTLTLDLAHEAWNVEPGMFSGWMEGNSTTLLKNAQTLLNTPPDTTVHIKDIENAASALLIVNQHGKQTDKQQSHALMEQLADRFPNHMGYKETGTCKVVTMRRKNLVEFKFEPKLNQAFPH